MRTIRKKYLFFGGTDTDIAARCYALIKASSLCRQKIGCELLFSIDKHDTISVELVATEVEFPDIESLFAYDPVTINRSNRKAEIPNCCAEVYGCPWASWMTGNHVDVHEIRYSSDRIKVSGKYAEAL